MIWVFSLTESSVMIIEGCMSHEIQQCTCCHCGGCADLIHREYRDPNEGRTVHTVVLPIRWVELRHSHRTVNLCPQCSDKLDIFLGKPMKNLAQELLRLSNSKKELDDNKIKDAFNIVCEELKEIAKAGHTDSILDVEAGMIILFERAGLVVEIQSSHGSAYTNPMDIVSIKVSWAKPTHLEK